MKTAKEWASCIEETNGVITEDEIREIQLDAWKQGVKDAENACSKTRDEILGSK